MVDSKEKCEHGSVVEVLEIKARMPNDSFCLVRSEGNVTGTSETGDPFS
jgi:hypothetical protein